MSINHQGVNKKEIGKRKMSFAQQFQRYRGFPVHKQCDQINHVEPLISHAEPQDLRIGQQVTNNKYFNTKLTSR